MKALKFLPLLFIASTSFADAIALRPTEKVMTVCVDNTQNSGLLYDDERIIEITSEANAQCASGIQYNVHSEIYVEKSFCNGLGNTHAVDSEDKLVLTYSGSNHDGIDFISQYTFNKEEKTFIEKQNWQRGSMFFHLPPAPITDSTEPYKTVSCK